jgi:hypothetical protein
MRLTDSESDTGFYTILARREYDDIAATILTGFKGRSLPTGGHVLLGHPGIGMQSFLIFRQLLTPRPGKTIFFVYFIVRMILLGQDFFVLIHGTVACCTSKNFFAVPVKQLTDSVNKLNLEQTILLMTTDITPADSPSVISRHKFYLVCDAAEDVRKVSRIRINRMMNYLWMYPCTWEEIYAAWWVTIIFSYYHADPHIASSVLFMKGSDTSEIWTQAYRRYGPILRSCGQVAAGFQTLETLDKDLLIALHKLVRERAELDVAGGIELDPQRFGSRVFLISPRKSNRFLPGVESCVSQYAASALLRELSNSKKGVPAEFMANFPFLEGQVYSSDNTSSDAEGAKVTAKASGVRLQTTSWQENVSM